MHSCLVTNSTVVTDDLAGSGPRLGTACQAGVSCLHQLRLQSRHMAGIQERKETGAVTSASPPRAAWSSMQPQSDCPDFDSACPWYTQSPKMPCCSGHISSFHQCALLLQEQSKQVLWKHAATLVPFVPYGCLVRFPVAPGVETVSFHSEGRSCEIGPGPLPNSS